MDILRFFQDLAQRGNGERITSVEDQIQREKVLYTNAST